LGYVLSNIEPVEKAYEISKVVSAPQVDLFGSTPALFLTCDFSLYQQNGGKSLE